MPVDAEDDGVLSVTGANHEALFPRCAAVVHHGGTGKTAVAARSGVPQVIAPHEFDQHHWADRLGRLSVLGPAVRARRRSVPELATALRAVVADEPLRERARALKASIRGDAIARTAAALERLAQYACARRAPDGRGQSREATAEWAITHRSPERNRA